MSKPFFPPGTIDLSKPVQQRCGRAVRNAVEIESDTPFRINYEFQTKTGEWVAANCRLDGFYSIFIGLPNDWDLVQAPEVAQ